MEERSIQHSSKKFASLTTYHGCHHQPPNISKMPIVTRSQQNKQSESQPEFSMEWRLSNPFDYPNLEDMEITEELLQECQESASFQRLMERLIEVDKEKYLLMLAGKGVKTLDDFD